VFFGEFRALPERPSIELEKNVFSPPVVAYVLLVLSNSGVVTFSAPLANPAAGFFAVGVAAKLKRSAREPLLYDAVFAAIGSSPPAARGANPCFFFAD
jgi:hypothetical protein